MPPVARSAGFSVAARTILELGAELISSDGIALYELIKNAYDAGSKRATIEITHVFRHSSLRNMLSRCAAAVQAAEKGKGDDRELTVKLKAETLTLLDQSAPEAAKTRFVATVNASVNLAELAVNLQVAYDGANELSLVDTGEGMSIAQLQDVFLTIGTRSRLDDGGARHFVGGKGLGRLSTMRLADHLRLVSTRSGEAKRSVLEIDWTSFSHASSEYLDEISVKPVAGETKSNPAEQGTSISLTRLKADWDLDRVTRLASTQLDRLFDPFTEKARYPVIVMVNGTSVTIPSFDKRILSEAQARASVSYRIIDDMPQLVYTIDYLAFGRTQTVQLEESDLLGITSREDVSLAAMRELGPFTAHFHWFNRQKLTAHDGIGTRAQVRDVVNHWANGLLLYRDGFRVNPYGAPDDDWLGIDVKALASSGYKVNRKQLIGAVNISARDNPKLIDQTNREGLRANEEKVLLVTLLSKVITDEFRNFLNGVERAERAKKHLDVKDTTTFLAGVSSKVQTSLKLLRSSVPSERAQDVAFLGSTYDELEERLKTARDSALTAQREQRDLVNLAGIGLLVEIVSHELGRVARQTLELISSLDRDDLPRDVAATFDSVAGQMLVIRRRLDMLDPLSPSGRNRREVFDLRELIEAILRSHENQFERNGIETRFRSAADGGAPFRIKAVPGMIIQIVENLIDNSVFWLKQQSRADPSFRPAIEVDIDDADQELRFTDNGPGIAIARAEDVFRPFVSSKPPGEGKGLGLYISKEIASYHGSDLRLLNAPQHGRLHTFVLDIGGLK